MYPCTQYMEAKKLYVCGMKVAISTKSDEYRKMEFVLC